MSMHIEVMVETTCCGRPRFLEEAVLTVRQIGLVIWATYRCKDCDACEQLERDEASSFCEPYLKVLAN
jgi:hypothetical protein